MVRRAWRDGRGRDGHPPRADVVPGGDGGRRTSPRTWPGCDPTLADEDAVRPRCERRVRDASGCGGPAHATCSPRRPATRCGDDEALPIRTARPIRRRPARPSLASRISYAGELGWELTTDDGSRPSCVWDALVAGRDRDRRRPRGRRVPRARLAPDGEGLSLLRHRHDDARHAVRGRSRGVRPAGRRAVPRPRGAGRRARTGRCRARSPPAHDPCRHGRRRTCRSTAARPSARTARWSAAFEASPSVRRSARRSATSTSTGPWCAGPPSRSTSSATACRRRSSTTSASTRAGRG